MSTSSQIKTKWDIFHKGIAREGEALIAKGGASPEPCNFCQSINIEKLFFKQGFYYAECQNCGLVFIYPQLSHDFLEKVYNGTQSQDFFFKEILLDFCETHQISAYSDRLQRIAAHLDDHVPHGKRLLDIGCAAGNFITLAQTQGWQVVGLELNRDYVAYARKERQLDVRNCSVEDLVEEDTELFNVVTMWDVPEHLYDPVGAFRAVSKLIKPGGVLAITTINHNCINAKLLQKDWRYYITPIHVYSFTPELLTRILASVGLQSQQIVHHYFWDIFTEGLMYKGFGNIDIRFPISDRLEYLWGKRGWHIRLERYTLMAVEISLSAIVKTVVRLAEMFQSGDIIEVYAKKEDSR